MKKLYMSILLVGIFAIITGCTSNVDEEIQMMSMDEVETIYIDHGSTNVYIDSTEAEELETSFISYGNGPGIKLNQRNHEIKISLKSDIRRMFNLGRMPELTVRIPQGYTGNIVVHGSSGQVHMLDVDALDIEVKGKSGRITLDFQEMKSNIDVEASSGNVTMQVDNKDINAEWLLQSSSGQRSVALPFDEDVFTNRKTSGRTGEGTYSVNIKTSSGNIRVE